MFCSAFRELVITPPERFEISPLGFPSPSLIPTCDGLWLELSRVRVRLGHLEQPQIGLLSGPFWNLRNPRLKCKPQKRSWSSAQWSVLRGALDARNALCSPPAHGAG